MTTGGKIFLETRSDVRHVKRTYYSIYESIEKLRCTFKRRDAP